MSNVVSLSFSFHIGVTGGFEIMIALSAMIGSLLVSM
jgi:hypothetical protein